MARVAVDTDPLVALFNRRDRQHRWATERFKELRPPLYTCEGVVVEASHLLRRVPSGQAKLLTLLVRRIVQIELDLGAEIEDKDNGDCETWELLRLVGGDG